MGNEFVCENRGVDLYFDQIDGYKLDDRFRQVHKPIVGSSARIIRRREFAKLFLLISYE